MHDRGRYEENGGFSIYTYFSDVGMIKLLPDRNLFLESLPVLCRRVLTIIPPVQHLHCIQTLLLKY